MRAVHLGLTCALAAFLTVAVATAEGPPAPSGDAPNPAAPSARAKHEVQVLVLHATNAGKGIDKRIREMPELRRPPFSSYDTYRLVGEHSVPLVENQPRSVRLPNGRVLRTELKQILADGYVRLLAAVNQPGGKDFLPLLEVKAKVGQAFIVAGQKYQGGILVLVIRVKERPPEASDQSDK